MVYTFKRGIHIEEHKNTEHSKIVRLPDPATVSIPLSQHIGAPCKPLVKVGDEVKMGQKIGDVESGLGCPIHSSVSGKVKAILPILDPSGRMIEHVIIDSDRLNTPSDEIKPIGKPICELAPDEIINVVREAGIVGMGGAGFPTYAKIASAIGKVDTMIINCAECEPYITANHRLLVERPEEVVGGAAVLRRALGLSSCVISIEDNKPDAIELFSKITKDIPEIKTLRLKTKYPQGDERQLIYAVTRREMPTGKLPADVGCVVFNAETVAAVYRAFRFGLPLIRRIVTVDGDCVASPGNLLVPIGASFRDCIDFCGSLKAEPRLLISGGPMMGGARWNPDAPVTKTNSAILVMSTAIAADPLVDHKCIRCGKCVSVCPMRLMPNYMASFSRKGMYDRAVEFGLKSCVECGCCSFVCPAGVQIVQSIRLAKSKLARKKS